MRPIAVEGLHRRFPGRPPTTALDGIDLDVAAGSLVAVLGPSGCGKTTLLRLVAGLDRPDAGTIRIGDELVEGPGHHVAPHRRGVGLVDAGDAERGVLAQDALVADDAVAVHHDPGVVVDTHTTADDHRVGQLDAVAADDPPVRQPVQHRQRRTQGERRHAHPPVAEPVHDERPETRRRPVAFVGGQVFAQQRDEPDALGVAVLVARPTGRGAGHANGFR